MALFKVSKGLKANLPSIKTDGYAYFCTDDGSFWIDYKDGNGILQRKQIDAGTVSGHIVQIDVPADAKFTDTTYNVVTTSENGLMSYSDKTKLDGIAEGAEVNVQADWNQNDETTADYIKNKPLIATDEDILDLLYSQGYLIPAGANDNTIYTDNNGNLYVL